MRVARTLNAVTVEDMNGRTSDFLRDPEVAALTESSRSAILRAASSLFRADALLYYRDQGYTVANPFEGAVPPAPEPMPFKGLKIDAIGSLIGAAQKELKPTAPGAYAVFIMALCAGMRAQECAWARWDDLVNDPATPKQKQARFGIYAISNRDHKTKSGKSRWIPLPQSAIGELLSLPKRSPFIVEDLRKARPRKYMDKRAEETLRQVSVWLKGKGIASAKPVHFLRKAYGAVIATEHGLYAAKEYLGHSTVRVTEQHYADLLEKPTVDLIGTHTLKK
jgi:integrase